jgi:uncharacterized protein YegL
MGDSSSEDMIFLLDTSTSMFRNDSAETSRVMRSIAAIQSTIDKKIKIDPKDRCSIVTFARQVHYLNEMVFTSAEIRNYIEQNSEYEKETALGEALAQAVQLILKEMRFIGQKLYRIIIFSDGIYQTTRVNPINIAKVAMQLGIVIDVVRFGAAQIPGNILKKLTEMTHGDYYYVASPSDLDQTVEKLSKKKEKKHSTIFDKKDDSEDVMIQEMMAEIADIPLKLEQMTEDQKLHAIYNVEKGKKLICTICYTDRCMVDKTGFFGCGRFCSNCLTPFHLHCAIMWSDQQNAKKGGSKSSTKMFRCPHCFYLLKIPISDVERSGNDTLDENSRILKKIENKGGILDSQICNSEDCGILFNKMVDTTVYQCSSCQSYFHLECAAKEWMKEKKCPYCKKYVALEQ